MRKRRSDRSGMGQDAWTPLSVAVFKGHGEVVDRLIEAKCDVNARTPQVRDSDHRSHDACMVVEPVPLL